MIDAEDMELWELIYKETPYEFPEVVGESLIPEVSKFPCPVCRTTLIKVNNDRGKCVSSGERASDYKWEREAAYLCTHCMKLFEVTTEAIHRHAAACSEEFMRRLPGKYKRKSDGD